MTCTKLLTLWCEHIEEDGHNCVLWTVGYSNPDQASVLRRGAQREGWVRRGGKDFCYRHARSPVATARDDRSTQSQIFTATANANRT